MSDTKKYDLESQLKSLGIEITQLTTQLETRTKQAMGLLQQQVYGLIVQKAQGKLKSTRDTYIKNLGMINDTDNLWSVYLKKEAAWIEKDRSPHEMIADLLGGPKAKTAKDGSRYNIIPFKHNKPKNQISRSQNQIQNVVSRELKSRGLDKTITLNGRPVLGRAASFNITGPKAPTNKFNTPILTGVTVYQREHKTQSGKTQIKRDIMTFRVVSDKQKGSGLWFSHGSKGANIFDEVSKEVDVLWDKMFKDVVDNVKIEVKE